MAVDFFAGCLGGCAGVLVGHPLDTIKVHLQTQDHKNPTYRGIWHCMTTIVANQNIRGLYRGISSPLTGVGFVNAIVFGIYGNVQRLSSEPDSLQSHILAGSVAGLLQSVVCAPMELAKTRVQLLQDTGQGGKYRGPLDCLKYIVRTEGLRGAFKGLTITAARDVPGFASYFASYEFMMRQTTTPNAMYSLVAGGLAGICSWLVCYPLDVVKTCLQADGAVGQPKYKGGFDCALQGYKAQGARFFFRGLNSTLLRSFPMNAACFYVVSLIMRMTKSDITIQPRDTIAVVGVSNGPLYQTNPEEPSDEETERRRFFMIRSLNALNSINEAVLQSEVEEVASEFYPNINQNDKYYIFEDERLYIENISKAGSYVYYFT